VGKESKDQLLSFPRRRESRKYKKTRERLFVIPAPVPSIAEENAGIQKISKNKYNKIITL